MTTYILGGGCFWCLDAAYRQLRGVTAVESGYAGGSTADPTYEAVASGRTGHAETVRVTFDDHIIPADIILDIFFLLHDPTTVDRQGADIGSQYRSIMLYASPAQRAAFTTAIARVQPQWSDPIVTLVEPLIKLYPAEPEHQDYFTQHPERAYCQVVINPKLMKLKAAYRRWLR